MSFKAHIKTDNAAFDGDATAEVARILRDIADRIERGAEGDKPVKDANGNTVGRWEFKQ